MKEFMEVMSETAYEKLRPEQKALYDYVFKLGVDPKEVNIVVAELGDLFVDVIIGELKTWPEDELKGLLNEEIVKELKK